MNICLLNDSFPPVIDGVVNVMMNYADYMMKDFDAKIIVGTPKYPDADYSKYPYQVVPYQSFDTSGMGTGYRTGNPFRSEALSELALFMPEIIHSHCPASATVVARLLREQTEAPIIFTYHTKYDIDIARMMKWEPAVNATVKAMVQNIEACDEVWTVSRGAGESLKALGYRGEYRVMDNGVDFAKGRVEIEKVREAVKDYDLPEGVPVFLFVGRIMTYKGIPIILDAMKILDQDGYDFRMLFVGKGPDMEAMQEKAREYGLMGNADRPDKVIFAGPIYDRDVLRAVNTRADLFLFPSTFDTNGLVVREAAACGLASVLIKGSCAAEGITPGRNGFTIDENAESMAALLKEVSGDLDHLHEVGQHAMDEIYLSWEQCVARAYHRYQYVLAARDKGLVKERKKKLMDYFLELTAWNLETRQRHRQIGREVFGDFKDTAVGMMDNFEEAGDTIEERMEEFGKKTEKSLRSIKVKAEKARDEVREFFEADEDKSWIRDFFASDKDESAGRFSESGIPEENPVSRTVPAAEESLKKEDE